MWVLGCAAVPGEEREQEQETTGTQASAITKGARDDASTWVVAVVGGGASCTGIYIGGGVVVTAGHCLRSTNPTGVQVLFQTSTTTLGRAPATGVTALAAALPTSDAEMKAGKDLATVSFDKCLVPAGIAPAPGFLTPSNGLSGANDRAAKVKLIGLGRTENDPAFGVRNQGDAYIISVNATSVALMGNPSGPAPGDSGGPMVIDRNGTKLIGAVASFITGDGGVPQYTRVDVEPGATFIAGAVFAATLAAVSACGGKTKCSTSAAGAGAGGCVVAPLVCGGGALAALVVRRRRRRAWSSSSTAAAAVGLVGLVASTGVTGCSSGEEPVRDCEDLASAYARSAARCGIADYEAARAQFVTSAAAGSCENVVEVRDEESLRSRCVPSFGTVSCEDLRAGKVDPACNQQLVRE